MKLSEFAQQLFEPWITELHEAFNTNISIKWEIHHGTYMGIFVVNEVPYVIQLHKPTITPVIGRAVAEVSFYLYNESDESKSFSTSKDLTSAPTAVYGIVLNAALEKADSFDGLYFTAEKRHSTGDDFKRKCSIYLKMAKRASSLKGGTVYNRESDSGMEILWVAEPLDTKDTWKRYPEDHLTI